jgi:2-polyprenyl-6-methoxyphenol hydroxylase-like FAD-dependent oxidoreductase
VRVLVIGAGIGGLSAYVSLRRAGVDAALFDQAEQAGATMVGGGFHVWPNGILALREVGLDEDARALGAHLETTEYCSYRGRKLAEWPVGRMARDLGAFDAGIARADLSSMLHGAAGADSVNTSSKLIDFIEEDGGVTARFANGREERGDVLIGADGLRSVVRAKLHGPAEPDFVGYVQWQTLVQDGRDLLPDGIERVTFGPGSRTVMHRVGGDRMFWACVIYGPETTGGRPAGRKAKLLQRFGTWPEPIRSALDAAPEEQITGLPIYDRKPVSQWGRGRVTLLGDAAHPMTTNTSQGGNQAIEDGVLIGRMLGGVAGDPAPTLRTYEQKRIARTTPLVRNSRFISDMNAWADPVRVPLRDLMYSIALPRKALSDQRKAVATPL